MQITIRRSKATSHHTASWTSDTGYAGSADCADLKEAADFAKGMERGYNAARHVMGTAAVKFEPSATNV
jgi:hypothetical protein